MIKELEIVVNVGGSGSMYLMELHRNLVEALVTEYIDSRGINALFKCVIPFDYDCKVYVYAISYDEDILKEIKEILGKAYPPIDLDKN